MYKNFVFDLGGVVVDYNPKEYLVDQFFHERTEKKIYEAVFGSKEWEKLDLGELTFQEASDIFLKRGREKDIEFEMQAVLDNWMDMLATRKATVNLMRLFKKNGFNLYYLSNIGRETLHEISKRSFWTMFDGGIASCDVGIAKPDPQIYQMLIDKFNLIPQETIFTDDRRENAISSFHVGITGIQFKNVKNLCKMLNTYGVELS